MNNFTIFLGFILIITLMFIGFPERGQKATKCLIELIGALYINEAFQAIIAYFNRNKPK